MKAFFVCLLLTFSEDQLQHQVDAQLLGDKMLSFADSLRVSNREVLQIRCNDPKDEDLPPLVQYGRRVWFEYHDLNFLLEEALNLQPQTALFWPTFSCFSNFVTSNDVLWKRWMQLKINHYVQAEESDEWRSLVTTLQCQLNTYLFFFVPPDNGNDDKIEAFEVYSPSLYPKMNCMGQVACESNVSDPLCDPMKDIWERRKNISDIHVKAVLQPVQPYAFHESDGNPSGIFPKIFLEVQKLTNFSFDTRPSVDGSWGVKLDNGSFTGIMGMLNRGEADIVMTLLMLSPQRAEIIDFSTPITKESTRLWIRSSDSFKLNTFDMLFVFYPEPWFCILAILASLIVGQVLIFADDYSRSHPPSLMAWAFHFVHGVARVTRAMLLIGYDKRSRSKSSKILLMTIMLMAVVIFTHIRAGLLSQLAIKRPRLPIESLDDLLESDLEFGTVKGGSSQSFFEQAPEGTIFKRLWDKKMKNKLDDVMSPNPTGGFAMVAERKNYVYAVYETFGKYASLYPCSIIPVGEEFNVKNAVFGFAKHSPLLDLFNHYLMRLRENGLLHKITSQYLGNKDAQCDWATETRLGMETLMGLFGAFLMGVALSLVLVIFEKVMSKIGFRVSSSGYPSPDTDMRLTSKNRAEAWIRIKYLVGTSSLPPSEKDELLTLYDHN